MTTPMPQEDWARRAKFLSAHDADTATMIVDLGWGISAGKPHTLRLLGLNAPELATPAGKEARAFAYAWFVRPGSEGAAWPFVVQTVRDATEKYGRYLATIWRVADAACLNDDLLAAGHAVPWDGHGPRPVPPPQGAA